MYQLNRYKTQRDMGKLVARIEIFPKCCNGVHGDQLPAAEDNFDEELEVYGINCQRLRDDGVLHLQAQNNSHAEGSSSWVGHTWPPPDLSHQFPNGNSDQRGGQ
ncbi:hypothetical protein K438DRAFT_1766975 [Mycena galopus ATCC 62051]|nr:hypothetical protein K438DRAFT_1766975 [Mycena galopus ATCC 62051]